MDDTAWVLRGVEPAARQRAAAEAARRGVSLAAYLTEALAEDIAALNAVAAAQGDARASDGFASWQHFQALERRLTAACAKLDQTTQGVALRVDETEALAAGAADSLRQALHGMGDSLAALRRRLTAAEESGDTLAAAHEATREGVLVRCLELDDRLDEIELFARDAAAAAAEATAAHIALKHAVAQDFSELAQETAARVMLGLDDLRGVADAAADQAQAAGERLVNDVRAWRETMEAQLSASAAETRQRMQAAFAEAAARIDALSAQVKDGERRAVRANEAALARLAHVEDTAQTKLEETADVLRQAGAALASEFARATRDNQAAIESVHDDLTAEIAALGERQTNGLVRQNQTEAALEGLRVEVATLHENIVVRLGGAESAACEDLKQARVEWAEQIAALAAQQAANERRDTETAQQLSAETDRIEACTVAALTKLAGDLSDVRAEQRGAEARLGTLDAASLASIADSAHLLERVSGLEAEIGLRAIDCGFDERLVRLEAGAESAVKMPAVQALVDQVSALAAQFDAHSADTRLAHRVDHLTVRYAAFEAQACEAATRVHNISAALDQTAVSGAEAAAKAEQRAEQLQLALANARQAQLDDASALGATIREMQERVAGLESQQAGALVSLQSGIAHLAEETDHRIAAMQLVLSSCQGLDAELDGIRRRVDEVHDAAAPAAALQALQERVSGVETLQGNALATIGADVSRLKGEISRRFEETDDLRQARDGFHAELDVVHRRLQQVHDAAAPIAALEALQERMAGLEARDAEALLALRADFAALADKNMQRVQKLEESQAGSAGSDTHAALDDLRQRLEEAHADAASGAALQAVLGRMTDLEARQADAFDAVREQLERFIAEDERRLSAAEYGRKPLQEEINAALDGLRRRMEERLADVEQRSVRALEQISDTMAGLEQRFMRGAEDQQKADVA